MKKWMSLLMLLVMISTSSLADENTNDTSLMMAQSLLTEVYGYTQEETDAFTYDVSDEDEVWAVRFYQNPEWVYKAGIKKSSLDFTGYLSPFTTLYTAKASENSVRYVLHAIGENEWFTNWNADSKKALDEAIAWCGDIRMNTSLRRGLQIDDYTPAQALDDFFLSCYGESALWSREVSQWRDAVFASFGLTYETAITAMPQGIVEYVVNKTDGNAGTTICEFAGEVPQSLTVAFSHPNLQGWVCLAGAYQALTEGKEMDTPLGMGLAAFSKGGERLLVMLLQDAKTLAWRVLPISKKALLPDRALSIVYGGKNSLFDIVYPISDTETEIFSCRLIFNSYVPEVPAMCSLEEYRYTDLSSQLELVINDGRNYGYADWFRVITTRNGVKEEAYYPALFPGIMEYIDAAAFPKTEEECRLTAEASPTMPEGYGFSFNVHLRAKATSYSDDLGMYRIGTLVEVLDSQPGKDFPWYHVRIGVAEGYMSGNYVEYDDNQRNAMWDFVTGIGKLTKDVNLRESTGFFAGTVAQLPAGTVVRVLTQRGNWLHVSVPQHEDDWLMQPDEINGYVRIDTVLQAVTALQFDWLDD